MLNANLTVLNETGVHMRPAQILVTKLAPLNCQVTIKRLDKDINAKSIMMVMAAALKKGHEVEVVCQGPDEAAALNLVTEFFQGVMDDA
ncbi:MAG: HPr family phosphocarrier protein [Deltaproteobacteria bacterium]|jgi:phosphocarrier protein|nr:HPr family phosphocarrier protein [Deltaproteobacteria bacterium]